MVYANGALNIYNVNNISASGSHFIADSVFFSPLGGGVSFDATTLDANGNAFFNAPSGVNFNNSTINADFALLNVFGTGSISINNTTINTPTGLTAGSAGDLDVAGSTLTTDAGSGAVKLASNSGSVSITGTSIATHYLTVNSGDGILLDASGKTLFATGAGATAAFSAPNLITINNADFSSFGVINMAANTITMANDKLSDIANFGTNRYSNVNGLRSMVG